MCRWMGQHFHNWFDYNGVAFSIKLLEWGRPFSDFGGKKVLHIYGYLWLAERTRMFVLQVKSKVFFIQYKKWVNSFWDTFQDKVKIHKKKVTKPAFHLSELTDQPIAIVMRISLLIKTNHPHQSSLKYYAQGRWFFSKTSWKKRISLPKCLVRCLHALSKECMGQLTLQQFIISSLFLSDLFKTS